MAGLAVAPLLAAVVVAGPASAGPASAGPAPLSSAPPTVAGGHVGLAPVVPARSHPATAAPATASARTFAKGGRAIPRSGVGVLAAAPTVRQESAAPAPATAGRLLQNFNGVSSRDSRNTNFDLQFEPPDPTVCAGNGFVLEAVNSAFTIYRSNGRRVRGPFNINDLFNEGASEFTSDPRCYYEAATHTWYAVILFATSDFATASRLDLAVNTSGDPTTPWKQYRIDTTDSGRGGQPSHPGCPCLGDQPLIGIDQHNLYLSTNEFSLAGTRFNGAQVYPVAKADLLAGRTAHFAHFDNLRNGGTTAASLQPALSTGRPAAEYFLDSLDPHGTYDNRIGVWAMTHRDRVARGGLPTLSHVVIRSQPYGLPPKAAQRGTDRRLDSDDDRMQQVQYVGGTLWGSLGTGLTIPSDSRERAGAAWFAVRPELQGDRVTGAVIRGQGYLAQRGHYLIYPALQADAAGRAAMVFTLTGGDRFPSAAYAVLGAGAAAFGPVRVAAAGTGPYGPHSTRWGDYSWAVLDPAMDAVWMAAEYIPPRSSQTPNGQQNWGTRLFKVALH